MRGLLPLVRKELLEAHRTFRLWILLAAFALVGLGSPLLAKLTPRLLETLGDDEAAGISIVINRDPSELDALIQFQKNYALLPLLIIVMFAGTVCRELQSGTAAMVLAKPVSRASFLAAKILVPTTLLLGMSVVATLCCALYTQVLFGTVPWGALWTLSSLMGLHLLLHFALTVCASTVVRSTAPAIGIALTGYIALMVLAALPRVGDWTPGALPGIATNRIFGGDNDVTGAAIATGLLLAALLFVAGRVLSAREV